MVRRDVDKMAAWKRGAESLYGIAPTYLLVSRHRKYRGEYVHALFPGGKNAYKRVGKPWKKRNKVCRGYADFISYLQSEGHSGIDEIEAPSAVEPEVITTKETGMSTFNKVKTEAVALAHRNKDSAVKAAKMKAGKVAIHQAKALLAKAYPEVAPFLESEVVDVLIANTLATALRVAMPTNPKACVVADACLDAAMFNLIDSIDIEGMFEQLVAGINFPALEFDDQ